MVRLDVGAGLNAAVNGGLAAERVVRSGWARLLRTRIDTNLDRSAGTAAGTGILAPAVESVQFDAWRPRVVGAQLQQPDSTTCGPSSLVMARLINNRSYRDTFVDDSGTVDAAAFADEVKTMRRMLCRPFDHSGRPQPPWIPALGTGPWAAARAMSGAGGAGRNGALYRVLPFDPLRPAEALAVVLQAAEHGEAVPLFVGNSATARHVVLVTGVTDPHTDGSDAHGPDTHGPAHLDYYDPADGQWHNVSCGDLLARNAVVAGWQEPWFAVVPARSARRPGVV